MVNILSGTTFHYAIDNKIIIISFISLSIKLLTIIYYKSINHSNNYKNKKNYIVLIQHKILVKQLVANFEIAKIGTLVIAL